MNASKHSTLLSYWHTLPTCTTETVTQQLIIPSTQWDHYSTLLSHSCALCRTQYSIFLVTTVFCLHPTQVVSFSIYSSAKCVCVRRARAVCLFQDMYGYALTLCECDGVLIEHSWSGRPSGAVNQNNGEPIMGALHFTGAIWLAITKKQIAMMTNKILTEAMPSSMMGWNRCYFIVIESYWQH